MIIEYVRYVLKQSKPEALVAAYERAAEALRAAPECIGYELSRCEEDPNAFVVRLRWESAEDHLSGFRKGPHFPRFFEAVRPFIGEIAEMRHYAVTDVVWWRS
jgi:quinol monooxygenase YgiN